MMQHVHLPVVIVTQLNGVDQLVESGIRNISRHNTFNQLQLLQEQ
jgi:hypothetical protein